VTPGDVLPAAVSAARRLLPTRADLERMTWAPKADLVAGLTVGLVALPLALAFGITSGMGAAAGLATAVVAGTVAALFGGSNVQVSGPTGAMTVVLIPIVAQHGTGGVFVVGALAGLMLVAMAAAGLGRYVRFVPLPVVEGFTLGIAVVIALQQLPNAFGVTAHGESALGQASGAVRSWLDQPHWAPLVMAVAVAALMLLAGRVRPKLPASLVAILLATVLAEVLDLSVRRVGALPSGLPSPDLLGLPWDAVGSLLLPALAVALLAALESLLSATVADAMSVSEHHDPDRELFGQGLANLASPLVGGMPATAAIARTAVNVRTGASSRLASVIHSAFLLLVVLAIGSVVSKVPVAALAGVLLATTIRMVDVRALRSMRRSGRGEALVLVATVGATVLLDLVQAVLLGVVAAGALALRRMAQSVTVVEVPVHEGVEEVRAEHALLDEHIVAYRIDGPLFFASAHQTLRELTALSDVRVVVLRLSRVSSLDSTGAAVLRDTITQLERRGITVLLSGLSDRHAPVLEALEVRDSLAHEQHLFATTPEAIAHARLHVSRVPHDVETAATPA
jgi:SulP family sulfate permease